MDAFILHLHSGLRWLILVAVAITLFKSIVGLCSKSNYSKLDKILAVSFVGMMHLQLLLGLILYFFYSSFITFNMSDPVERFWSVEHLVIMILAVVAAQIGRSTSKKANDAHIKFRFQSILFTISLVLMLLGIPWNRV